MSTGLFQDEEDGYNIEEETKYKLKLDAPKSEPAFGDSGGEESLDGLEDLGGEDDLGGLEDLGDDDKPFDDEPFDAGVEADETEEPEKYIQQLSGKLGTTLRKYSEDRGEPDFDLEKFAINSVISATHTAEMDEEDQKDIISKVKNSGAGEGEEDLDLGDEDNVDDLGGEEDLGDDLGGDLDLGGEEEVEEAAIRDLDAEREAGRPNLRVYMQRKGEEDTPYERVPTDETMLGDDIEINESKELKTNEKSSIFVEMKSTYKNKLREMVETAPRIKPNETEVKPSPRRKRIWEVKPSVTPKPKAMEESINKDIEFNGKMVDYTSLEIHGVDPADYPEFVDAYIGKAYYTDGIELDDNELDMFTDANPDLVYDLAYNSFY